MVTAPGPPPGMRGVGKTYQEVYSNYIVNNEVRNNKLLGATRKLVDSGEKVLILVTRIEHASILLKKLEKDLKVESLDGRNKTSDRLASIEKMKNGKLDVLIASKIFDQGIDIAALSAIVLLNSGKSSARALQRIGRVIRKNPGKKKAIVIDTMDNCKFLRDHSKARYKIYSSEPAFRIKMPKRK